MSLSAPYTEILEDDDDTAGIHRSTLSAAVCCWAWMQDEPVTVADAAITFNTTPALIRRAVEDHPWVHLDGDENCPEEQVIEHDGE